MTDQPPSPGAVSTSPAPDPPPAVAASVRGEAAGGRASAQPPSGPLADVQKLADERPEVAVGAAFGGGLVLAMILRRLAR